MQKTTIQVCAETGEKLKALKKITKQPIGVLADIGLDYLEKAIRRGEIVIQNGQVVKKAS